MVPKEALLSQIPFIEDAHAAFLALTAEDGMQDSEKEPAGA